MQIMLITYTVHIAYIQLCWLSHVSHKGGCVNETERTAHCHGHEREDAHIFTLGIELDV